MNKKLLAFIMLGFFALSNIFLLTGCKKSGTIIDPNSQEMTELPFLYIETKDMVDIVSKEDYVECNVSLTNTDYEFEFSDIKGKIKGRGNSTWSAPKKPYKLKFDKKVDLFGDGAAKTWTILANYYDKSQIRNYLAFGGMSVLLQIYRYTIFITIFYQKFVLFI